MLVRSLAIATLLACGSSSPHPTTSTPTTTPTAAAGSNATTATTAATPSATALGACSNGTLWIGPPASFPAEGATGDVGTGDVNGDGAADVIVGSTAPDGSPRIGVMFGGSDTKLAAPVWNAMLAGDLPRNIATTDFDNDNDLDILSVGGKGPPEVFLNNADGTFGVPRTLPGAPRADVPRTVRAGDLDGDHDADIAENAGGEVVAWYQESGQFIPTPITPVRGIDHAGGLAIADLDHDGFADMILAGTSDGGKATIAVLKGQTHKLGAPERTVGAPITGNAVAVTAADFNGDGKLDIAALFTHPPDGTLAILLTGANGRAFAATLPVSDVDDHAELVAGDIDGDGKADVFVSTTHGIAVFRAAGKTFAPVGLIPANGLAALTAADVNADHALELVGVSPGQVTVWPTACR
jgi:hypothetical protein